MMSIEWRFPSFGKVLIRPRRIYRRKLLTLTQLSQLRVVSRENTGRSISRQNYISECAYMGSVVYIQESNPVPFLCSKRILKPPHHPQSIRFQSFPAIRLISLIHTAPEKMQYKW